MNRNFPTLDESINSTQARLLNVQDTINEQDNSLNQSIINKGLLDLIGQVCRNQMVIMDKMELILRMRK